MRRLIGGVALGAAVVALGSCATNPATGRRQLALVSEGQEIAMGFQNDTGIVQQLGVYPDSGLQRYVRGLGEKLAAVSERPSLPWSFRVVDDPVVNAFAVPGGFIYVTRGILAHMNSEAQLAAVLGHEIGHVTARHSVEQLSRAQLAQVGLGIGMVFSETVRQYGQVAGAGIGVLFLKFGRDDETEADRLGLRYMTRGLYHPFQMAEVFTMLGRVSGGEGGRAPSWLSTHPDPENRRETILREIGTLPAAVQTGTVGAESYLQRLNGLMYGPNPREGYFEGTRFFHPDLAFQFDFPAQWQTANQKQAVVALSPEKDALIEVSLAGGVLDAAAGQFFNQVGATPRRTTVNSLPAIVGAFTAQADQGVMQGVAMFISHGGATYRVMGYAPAAAWPARAGAVERALGTFQRLTDAAALGVQPNRLEIVRLNTAMSFADFMRRYPSEVPAAQIALINQVNETSAFPPGAMVKRVVKGR